MATKATLITRVKSITLSLIDQGYLNNYPLVRLKTFPSSLAFVDDSNLVSAVRLWAKTIHEQVLMGLPYQTLLDMAKNDEKINWIRDLVLLIQE